MRLVLRVAAAIRNLMPDGLPLFVRISATDWETGGWDADQSVVLARHLKSLGVDLIDVSSGALVPKAAHSGRQGLSGTLCAADSMRGGDHDGGGRNDCRDCTRQ